MTTFFRLKVFFYQYNDGSANNGHYWRYVDFNTKDEADREKRLIDNAIKKKAADVGMSDSDDTLPDYIYGCCGGYYTKSPELFLVTCTKME